MINHITTERFRTKRVWLALERVFDEPAAFFESKLEYHTKRKKIVVPKFEKEDLEEDDEYEL